MFDGRHLALPQLIGAGWKQTFTDPNLAELYVRFMLDTAEFGGNQFYVISDQNDFVMNDDLKATVAPPDERGTDRPVSCEPAAAACRNGNRRRRGFPIRGLDVSEAMLIPPTTVRIDAQPVLVFATVVHLLQLHHLCLAISMDGKIMSCGSAARQAGGTLPVHPLRSFDDQRPPSRREAGSCGRQQSS